MEKKIGKSCFILIIIGLLFLGACAPAPSAHEPSKTDAGVYLPQLAPMEEMPLALMYGQLVNEDGCLRLVANEGEESYLILWPAEVNVIATGGMLVIQDADGEVVARVDQQIGLVGGEYTQRDWVEGLLQPGSGLPEDCPGPYWLTGEIIEPEL